MTLVCSYTSVGLVTSAFPAIASATNINSSVIAQYAGGVEAEINTMLSKRYALPLTVECPLLTAIATRETIFRICVQRALITFPPAQQGQHPLQFQHKDDQALLKEVSEGGADLLDSSGGIVGVSTAQAEIWSTTKDYIPTFHEGSFGDMVVDPDKLDDILSDRDL